MQNIAKHYVRSSTQWKILIRDPNVIPIKFSILVALTQSAQTKKVSKYKFVFKYKFGTNKIQIVNTNFKFSNTNLTQIK